MLSNNEGRAPYGGDNQLAAERDVRMVRGGGIHRHWYVIRTEPRGEYMAAEELARDGFEVFFPCIKFAQNRQGHTDSPLFPGYLFLRYDAETNGWPTFRMAHRIAGWVNFAGLIPEIPDEIIAELGRRVEAVNSNESPWRSFQPGETVRLIFQGLDTIAEVVDVPTSPMSKVRVNFEFLGRLVPAQVSWENLVSTENKEPVTYRRPRRTRGNGRWVRGSENQAVSVT